MEEVQKFNTGAAGDQPTVYVSTNEMVVQYRPFSEIERWALYRMSEKSEKKNRYVFWLVAGFFFLGGPVLVSQLIQYFVGLIALGSSAGAAATHAASASTFAVLGYFYMVVGSVIASAAAIYLSRPTHLRITDQGLQYIWYRRFKSLPFTLNVRGDFIRWESISRVFIEKPSGKPSPNDHVLTFSAGSAKAMRLRLGAFWTMDDRSHLLEAIERWAPALPRDTEVISCLEPPADYSYTELWMKALSAPPKRERLKPLVSNSYLREGKYRISDALGVGGQGTAYLAYDVGADNRSVVLKEFILPVYVDITVRKQALDKFEREAKILKQLDHPQVVKLIDFFVEDHRGYLVLEHIDGGSLRQRVDKEGKAPENAVVQLALQMCEILSYLHGLTPPVVHRDFTPDNLILRNDGTLKLVDFNVAQQTESTATGTVVGKHAYLPPEQFRGMPTTQSDIYAMGATLFYMLTGEDPEPISECHPRELLPAVSAEFDRIVGRCTAIDPALRYQSSSEILADLTQLTQSAVKPQA
jgi:tRNA A-37 threonylcarbamoyl transferase component Bud32